MIIGRFILVLLVVFSLSSWSLAKENSTSSTIYPDLLGDEFLEEEDLDEVDEVEVVFQDPLEPVNRFFFTFNDKLYEWVLKPVTDGYIWVVPRDLRESFGNFFFNMAMPIRLLNALLQAEFKESGIVLQRFVINSTLGVYGLVDIAFLEFDLEPRRGDFGQTLGKWGLGDGIYFCWPLFGPSSLRDSFGLVVDAYVHPVPYFHNNYALDLAYYTSNKLNTLSLNPNIYEDLKKYSLDPYIATRQAYFDYRRAFVDR